MSASPATAPADHVLVKGWHDSGGVEAVYGPYTRAHAEWLAREIGCEGSCGYKWTIVSMQDFQEPPS